MNSKSFGILKTRRFLPLFLTQFLEAFNDNFFKNALVLLITYTLAHSPKMAEILVTIAFGIFILPFFLFSATAGQLADKFDKAILIRIIKIVEISAMLFAAIGFAHKNISLLMATLFLMGIHSAFFGPIKFAILPDQLHKDELISGNAYIEASTFIAILLGTILGGIFIAFDAGSSIVSMLGIIIAIAGLACSFLIPKTKPAQPELNISFNVWKETKNILLFARENKQVYLSILGISWFWLAGAVLLSQYPTFTKNIIGANASVVTLFLALFSIGIAVGSLISDRVQKGQINAKYVPFSILAMSIFIVDLYFASHNLQPGIKPLTLFNFLISVNHWRMLFDTLLLAVCGGLYIVPLYTIMQTAAEDTHRSRVIAANNIINALFMVLAAALCSILLTLHISIPQLFLLLGLLNTLVAFYTCKLLPDALIKSFAAWTLKFLYRVKVHGMENYEKSSPKTIIVANHVSFLDALLLSAFLPEKMLFAINTSVAKKWWLQPFLALVNTFPLDPSKPMSIKSLIQKIQVQNCHCIIFPEGRLTTTGALMKIYQGPGLVADKTHADILPIRIDGAQYTPFSRLKGKVRIRWFPEIHLIILPPRKFYVDPQIKGRARRRLVSDQLYDLMTDLLFESSPYQQTLFASLIEARNIHGGRTKIIEDIDRKPVNYNQLIMKCFILGSYMAKQSAKGEYVGLLLPNSIATAVSFFGLNAFGRIPAMLNFSSGIKNLSIACQTAQIKTVYTSRKFIETAKLSEIITKLLEQGIHVSYLEDLRSQINIFQKLHGYLRSFFPKTIYHRLNKDINPQHHSVILFTSGSEGTPKGVVHSHESILANVYQMTARVDFNSNDIAFNPLPVFHCFGLTTGMILPLVSGIKSFLYPSPLHYRIIPELVYDINATMLFGTDTFLSGYAKNSHSYDFYSIRYIFAGAEKLKEETRKVYAEKFGINIYEGYGTTETAPVISTNTPMQNKNGTVGRFLPKINYQLEPVAGIQEGGRLMVTGPNIMCGYLLADQPGTLRKPENGWHDTGDIASVDAQGYLMIKGRAKRFAKIGGEMVSLAAVETYLSDLWPEFLHAVSTVPDVKKGEVIILVTENKTATRQGIIDYFHTQGIAEINLPKKVIFLEKLPVLPTGKIDYVALANLVASMTE